LKSKNSPNFVQGKKTSNFFHQSSSATDLFEEKQILLLEDKERHQLIQDCPTRWNSTLAMMRRLLEQTPAIIVMVNDPKVGKAAVETIKSFSYTFYEQSLVKMVVQFLDPFEKATTILCADLQPTMTKVLPILKKISKFTEIKDGDPKVTKL
jgi:hypothetical protein